MTDLERRALLGDREAQEECTRRGIALRCPICGRSLEKTDDGTRYIHVDPCTFMPWAIDVNDKETLDEWNTRPARLLAGVRIAGTWITQESTPFAGTQICH